MNQVLFFLGESYFNQLMANWWFGARWFRIRIGIPISKNPFYKGMLGESKPLGRKPPMNHWLGVPI